MANTTKKYHSHLILLWIFTIFTLMVFNNVFALQSDVITDKFKNEQVDINQSVHFSWCISYQCASSILNKKHTEEQFSFLPESKEFVRTQLLKTKYKLQKKGSEQVVNTFLFNLLRATSQALHTCSGLKGDSLILFLKIIF